VGEPFDDDTIERSGDFQVGFEILLRLHRRLRGTDGLFARSHEGLRRLDLLLGLLEFNTGNGAGRFRGFLEARCGDIDGGELRLGLGPVRLGGLHARFGFGDAGVEFGRGELNEKLATLHDAAAVDENAIDVAGDLGGERDVEVGLNLRGEVDGAGGAA
jgi:hypothetical protein